MSTATAERSNIINLDVVRTNKERMGFLLAARARIRQAKDLVIAKGRSILAWVTEKFHLNSVKEFIVDVLTFIKVKGGAVARFFGNGGLIGAGLLTVSTAPGHKLLATVVGKPVNWLLRMAGKIWHGVENVLVDHGGRPGQWVACRMSDLETFLIGPDGDTKNFGLVGKVVGFYGKHVAQHLRHDSTLMSSVQVAGAALLAAPFVPFMGFSLVGAGAVAFVASMAVIGATPGKRLVEKVRSPRLTVTLTGTSVKEQVAEVAEAVTKAGNTGPKTHKSQRTANKRR